MNHQNYKGDLGECELCTSYEKLTFHHLIPKSLHSKTYYKKRYSREYLKNHGINVCVTCHRSIHDLISIQDLGRRYNQVDLLIAHHKFNKYLKWRIKRV